MFGAVGVERSMMVRREAANARRAADALKIAYDGGPNAKLLSESLLPDGWREPIEFGSAAMRLASRRRWMANPRSAPDAPHQRTGPAEISCDHGLESARLRAIRTYHLRAR